MDDIFALIESLSIDNFFALNTVMIQMEVRVEE